MRRIFSVEFVWIWFCFFILCLANMHSWWNCLQPIMHQPKTSVTPWGDILAMQWWSIVYCDSVNGRGWLCYRARCGSANYTRNKHLELWWILLEWLVRRNSALDAAREQRLRTLTNITISWSPEWGENLRYKHSVAGGSCIICTSSAQAQRTHTGSIGI